MRNFIISFVLLLLTQQNIHVLYASEHQPVYADVIDNIALKLAKTSRFYKSSATDDRQKLLAEAQTLFINSNVRLMPYWLGTTWSFHGTSKTPKKGSIACGYFITTILEDAGLGVERAKLAQQTSENIIKSLTSEKYIKRYSNKSLKAFVNSIQAWGKGLYIVGLDFHVGFIWHDGNDIHSTFVQPSGVIKEPAFSSPVLAASRYRVLGKISDDRMLIEKWLYKEKIVTIGKH